MRSLWYSTSMGSSTTKVDQHEPRVILHNRENALLTQAVQGFARDEHEYAENMANNWMSLFLFFSEGVENMPYK